MALLGNSNRPTGGCGIINFFGFSYGAAGEGYWDNKSLERTILEALQHRHAGLFMASFIETRACKAAYNLLTSRFRVVYQSSVRRNENTGNDFFMCVFERL